MDDVIRQLQRLRRQVRFSLLLQRAGVVFAAVLVVLLALIGLDYLLRFPAAFRVVLLAIGVVLLVVAWWRYVRPAVRFHPTLTQIALRTERSLPALRGRLASAIEFKRDQETHPNPLAARSVAETEARLQGESIRSVRNNRLLRRSLLAVLLAVAAVGMLITLQPGAAHTGFTRVLLPFSDAAWPARTGVASLTHQVVPVTGVYPRGEVLPMRAQVTRGDEDQRVIARYQVQRDGRYEPWQRIVLTHQMAGVHERLVDTNAEAIQFYFETEDARTDVERVQLEPTPQVVASTLTVAPPNYADQWVPAIDVGFGQGIDDRSITESPVLMGSDVSLQLQLNKPLPVPDMDRDSQQFRMWLQQTLGWSAATEGSDVVDDDAAGEGADPAPLPEFAVHPNDPSIWQLRWTLAETRTLDLNLVDQYELTHSEPIRFRIMARADRLPSATVTRPQRDEIVLPTAVVDVQAEARDDVAVTELSVQAAVDPAVAMESAQQREAMQNADEQEQVDAEADDRVVWSQSREVEAATGSIDAELDLSTLDLQEGDTVLLTAIAGDVFNLNGDVHEPVVSAPRRLHVISELEFATQLRRELGAIRQNSIRIEAAQAELQDSIIDNGPQPGSERAQAQIGRRIAEQRDMVDELEAQLRQNRLEDPQLSDLIRQSRDLLDFAGAASNRAARQLQDRGARNRGTAPEGNQDNADAPAQDDADAEDATSTDAQPVQDEQQGGEQQGGERQGDDDERNALDERQFRQPAEADRPIVDAQQNVREELADLIALLDRDEDTWVITRQLENLLAQQQELSDRTDSISRQTIGRSRDELSEPQRDELDRIAQRQSDLGEQLEQLIEDMRDRADAMEDVDPQSAGAMRRAADTGEEQELQQRSEEAAEQVEQNQLRTARDQQQSIQQTLEQMRQQTEQAQRARTEELLRQLASLIESIQRLVTVQENELIALGRAIENDDFSQRDRAMIRLNQNTTAVSSEARMAGQESRRIARTLDRAADAQGAAVTALRQQPPDGEGAREAEEYALEQLKESLALAEQLQQETEQQHVQQQRQELVERYRELAETQVAMQQRTLELQEHEQLNRRQLVEARRLGSQQDQLTRDLHDVRVSTSVIMDSRMMSHVHDLMETWSREAAEQLQQGGVRQPVTDRQQRVAQSIGDIIQALDAASQEQSEFADGAGAQQQGEGGQQAGPQPLIPPVAELRLLRSMQIQVYEQTRKLDAAVDTDPSMSRQQLRELGRQQRDLMELGQQIIDELEQQ